MPPSTSTPTSTSSPSSPTASIKNKPIPPTFRQRKSSSAIRIAPEVHLGGTTPGSGTGSGLAPGSSTQIAPSPSTTSGPSFILDAPKMSYLALGNTANAIEGEGGTPRSFQSFSTRPPLIPSSSSITYDRAGVVSPSDRSPDLYPSPSPSPHPYPYPSHARVSTPKTPHALPAHMRTPAGPAPRRDSGESEYSLAEEGEATPLLRGRATGSGAGVDGEAEDGLEVQGEWYEGPLLVAGVKLALLFMAFAALVAGTFYYGMPPVDAEDRPLLKIPKSFADMQALNGLFQKYKRQYPLSLLSVGVVSYLFVQTFSLPGSMYISILFGAAYGMLWGLLLSCLCESIGSVFCYAVSAILAPPLLTIPFYRARVETWRRKIMGTSSATTATDGGDGDTAAGPARTSWVDIGAFLLVLRITPFPPHWVCNVVAPHLGIPVLLFWGTCFVGIAPVSVIHVTIGASLDSMTSAADFHVLSVRNVLGLIGVVVAVLIPVGLKRVFKKDLGDLGVEAAEEVQVQEEIEEAEEEGVDVGAGAGYGSVQRTRYHAVDSGLVLAGPSQGGDLELDPAADPYAYAHTQSKRARGKTVGKSKGTGKGKARALEVIPDAQEEDEVLGDGVGRKGAADVAAVDVRRVVA